MSKVSEFYANKVIFVTGATGFCGKAIVENLLRKCSSLKRIYILLRQKKESENKQRNLLECYSISISSEPKGTIREIHQRSSEFQLRKLMQQD